MPIYFKETREQVHPSTSHPASMPASVAQLDARPTGGQEVSGSTPAGSAKFFR